MINFQCTVKLNVTFKRLYLIINSAINSVIIYISVRQVAYLFLLNAQLLPIFCKYSDILLVVPKSTIFHPLSVLAKRDALHHPPWQENFMFSKYMTMTIIICIKFNSHLIYIKYIYKDKYTYEKDNFCKNYFIQNL